MAIQDKLNEGLTTKNVSPDQLYLDLKNPRLFGDSDYPLANSDREYDDLRAQEVTRRYVLSKHNVTPLINSILEVGFLKMDRLVVREFDPGKYVVVEGNRRLTAVKTILGDIKRKQVDTSSAVLKTLSELEVLCLESDGERADLDAWLVQGLRHITGVRNWGPYQQAKLVHTLVKCEGQTFKETGLAIGIHPNRASSMLRGLLGLEQMQRDPDYGDRASTDYFSHFEQAYLKKPVREWLGWDEDKDEYCNQNNLKQFYELILNGNPEISQPKLRSQEIRDVLPLVLVDDEARDLFLGEEINISEAKAIVAASNGDRTKLFRSASKIVDELSSMSQIVDLEKRELSIIKALNDVTGQLLRSS